MHKKACKIIVSLIETLLFFDVLVAVAVVVAKAPW